MAARLAALALAFGLLLQVATSAPSFCGCGSAAPGFGYEVGYGIGGFGGYPVSGIDVITPGYAVGGFGGVGGYEVIESGFGLGGIVAEYPGYGFCEGAIGGYPGFGGFPYGVGVAEFSGYPGFIGAGAVGFEGYSPAFGGYGAGPVGATAVSPAFPVGSEYIVDSTAGPTSSFKTPPVCQTAVYESPSTSYTDVKVGPVKEIVQILDGYCDSSCAATRAKCGGTTKNVAVGDAVVLPVGSVTDSNVNSIGPAVTTANVIPGTPIVESRLIPGGPVGTVGSVGPYVSEFGYGPFGISEIDFVGGFGAPGFAVGEIGYGYPGYGAGYGAGYGGVFPGYGGVFPGYGGAFPGYGGAFCEEIVFPHPAPISPVPFPVPTGGYCPCY